MIGCQSAGTEQVAQSHDGAELFRANCASCHGTDARGDGPMAKMLVGAVPDLTVRQFDNKLQVIQVIDGRGMRAAHGTADMPVWGWALREAERSSLAEAPSLRAALRRALDAHPAGGSLPLAAVGRRFAGR